VGPARLRGSVFYPGGGSAVWPHSAGCVLCALWAVSAAVLGGGGGPVFCLLCGGKRSHHHHGH